MRIDTGRKIKRESKTQNSLQIKIHLHREILKPSRERRREERLHTGRILTIPIHHDIRTICTRRSRSCIDHLPDPDVELVRCEVGSLEECDLVIVG